MDPIHPLNDPERAGIRKRDIQPPSIDDMHLVGRLRETVGLPRVSCKMLDAFILHCFFFLDLLSLFTLHNIQICNQTLFYSHCQGKFRLFEIDFQLFFFVNKFQKL